MIQIGLRMKEICYIKSGESCPNFGLLLPLLLYSNGTKGGPQSVMNGRVFISLSICFKNFLTRYIAVDVKQMSNISGMKSIQKHRRNLNISGGEQNSESKHLNGQLDPPVRDVTFFNQKEVS